MSDDLEGALRRKVDDLYRVLAERDDTLSQLRGEHDALVARAACAEERLAVMLTEERRARSETVVLRAGLRELDSCLKRVVRALGGAS